MSRQDLKLFLLGLVGTLLIGSGAWLVVDMLQSSAPREAAPPPVVIAPEASTKTAPPVDSARKDVEDAVASAPEIARFFDRLRLTLPTDYESAISALVSRRSGGASDSPDYDLSQAVKTLRQSRGALAAKADSAALGRVFEAQLAVLKALSAVDSRLCVDFLYGGASEAFLKFSATNRALVSDLAIAGLEAGHRVLCEKPLATNLADARRVVDAELAVGERRIQMGFMREYDPAHRQLQAALADLGRLDAWRSVHRNVNDAPRPITQIVGQSLVHDFHSVHFVTGEPIVEVHGFCGRPIGDSYRHVVAMCRTASGLQAVIEFDDCGFGYEVTVDVLAEHGDAATGEPLRALVRRDGSKLKVIGPDWFAYFAEAYRIQDAAWVASIRAGRATGPSTWAGVRAQAVVDAVLESITTGATVAVPQDEVPAIYR